MKKNSKSSHNRSTAHIQKDIYFRMNKDSADSEDAFVEPD